MMADAVCMFSVRLPWLDTHIWFKLIRFCKDHTETASPPPFNPNTIAQIFFRMKLYLLEVLHHLQTSAPPGFSAFTDTWSQHLSSLLIGFSWFNTTHSLIPISVVDPRQTLCDRHWLNEQLCFSLLQDEMQHLRLIIVTCILTVTLCTLNSKDIFLTLVHELLI